MLMKHACTDDVLCFPETCQKTYLRVDAGCAADGMVAQHGRLKNECVVVLACCRENVLHLCVPCGTFDE